MRGRGTPNRHFDNDYTRRALSGQPQPLVCASLALEGCRIG
jgi:hypothetical protein